MLFDFPAEGLAFEVLGEAFSSGRHFWQLGDLIVKRDPIVQILQESFHAGQDASKLHSTQCPTCRWFFREIRFYEIFRETSSSCFGHSIRTTGFQELLVQL